MDTGTALDLRKIDAVIFDMDGVVTSTARVHAAAWKKAFDEFLRARAERAGAEWEPFGIETDYRRYVDGKARYDGVEAFLASRMIFLPFGDPGDPPGTESVCGLGNRKNRYFLRLLKEQGADSYPSTVSFAHRLKSRGIRTAVISASRNARTVLEAAKVADLFDATVSGVEADELGLEGKPAPDIFLEAARRLQVDPGRTAVVEDALAGVKAARAGGFSLVVGVSRDGQRNELREWGAHTVVGDLSELRVEGTGARVRARALPSALDDMKHVFDLLSGGTPVVFLDYDGTLTPIVERPEDALMPREAREIVEKIAERWMTAIVSGRDTQNVRAMVGLDRVIYAGSHGFDILGQEGSFHDTSRGERFLPSLDRAEQGLKEAVSGISGAVVERKRFAIALHYRRADRSDEREIEKRFDRVLEDYPDLRKSAGKKIFELRPDIEWDKGKAVLNLMDRLQVDGSRQIPLYIGDDTTDEDAFRAIDGRGVGIVVGAGDRDTAATYRLRDPSEVVRFLEELLRSAEREVCGDAWTLVYNGFDPDGEKLRETLCSTGNGYFVTRGAAPESSAGEVHYPGTYLAGCYNRLKSDVAGRTIENESIVNAPNWLPLQLRVEDGGWFDPETARLEEYRQELDMRGGVLGRTFRFSDERDRRTRVVQRRFVHMGNRHIAALETVAVPENWSGSLHVRSAINGGVENTLVERYRNLNNHHLEQEARGFEGNDTVWLQARTTRSHIRIAEAARTRVVLNGSPLEIERTPIEGPDFVGQEFSVPVEEGKPVRIEKTVAISCSRDPAISESRIEALAHARRANGFEGMLESHRTHWRHLWDRCRIDIEAGSDRTEQILNLHIFHLLQTVSTHTIDQDSGVPPRGLHGEAYRGLIMWDELFVFPFLNLRIPDITRALLRYRYRRLPRARWAALDVGRSGAMFPWQSGSDGREEAQTLHLNPKSGNWIPDHTHLERHINLAVAYNVWLYYQATGDMAFLSFYGAEMLIEIARFWAGRAEYDEDRGRYVIRGVMGPDEFHDGYPDREEPGIDNNAYTNVLAVWVMCRAMEALGTVPPDRRRSIWENLGLDRSELELWERISRKMFIPFHGEGIISQFERYDELEEFDWDGYRERYGDIERLDRILEAEEDTPNRYKVSKQADVLMLFYLFSKAELGELFDRLGYSLDGESMPRMVDYYIKRTSHGSTLSRVVHSWVLSRSDRESSWHLFQDALESDVSDIQGGTTHEGIHLGAMAGTVDLVQRCYTGLEVRGDMLRFNPHLPGVLEKVAFNIRYRGHLLDVEVTTDRLRIVSRKCEEEPISIALDDEIHTLEPGGTLELKFDKRMSSI